MTTNSQEQHDRDKLLKVIATLQTENSNLRENIIRLEEDIRVGDALKAESLIARLTGGRLATNNDDHDVFIPQTRTRLEVKFSRINIADKRHRNPTARWAWHKIFGSGGHKCYDRLILIGQRDARFFAQYRPSAYDVVAFDVPYAEVASFTIRTSAYKQEMRSIQLVTNPKTTASTASRLFVMFQTTIEDIEGRYRGRCEIIE
jgi:hypothetical protein